MMKKRAIILLMTGLTLLSFSQEVKKEAVSLDAKGCYEKSIDLMKAGDPVQAVQMAERAVALDGDNSKYHFQLGMALGAKVNHKDTQMMEKMGLAERMLEAFQKAVELDKTNIPARHGLTGFYLNAPPFIGGNVEKAEEQAREIAKLDELQGNLAFIGIHLKKGEIDQAVACGDKLFTRHMACLEKGENSQLNSMVLNTLGYALVNAGKKDQALLVFQKNVKAFPEDYNTYDSLAETYQGLGQKVLALENYEKALKMNPNQTDFEKKAYLNQQEQIKALKE